MAYDEHLAERISRVLQEKRIRYTSKKMMGGLCYMINEKMAFGIMKDFLLARIDPELYQS
jgi:hypothetical protein